MNYMTAREELWTDFLATNPPTSCLEKILSDNKILFVYQKLAIAELMKNPTMENLLIVVRSGAVPSSARRAVEILLDKFAELLSEDSIVHIARVGTDEAGIRKIAEITIRKKWKNSEALK